MTKILLVEDDTLFRNSLKKVLTETGITVIEAADGSEGLKLGLKQNPEIIVTDYMLPDFDGITMVDSLKERSTDIVAILITAHNKEEIVNRARASGFFEFLYKPIDIGEFESLIQKAIKKHQLIQRNASVNAKNAQCHNGSELSSGEPAPETASPPHNNNRWQDGAAFLEKIKVNSAIAAILESLPMGIIVFDNQFKTLYINRVLRNIAEVHEIQQKCLKILGADNPGHPAAGREQSPELPDGITPGITINRKKYHFHYERIEFYDGTYGHMALVFEPDYFMKFSDKGIGEQKHILIFRQIGHEINNFLTVLMLRTEMLKLAAAEDKKLSGSISLLAANMNRLKRYAGNLLFLGRPAAAARGAVDLAGFLRQFLEHPEAVSISGGHTIRIETAETELHVAAAREVLEQIFINVLSLIFSAEPYADEIIIHLQKNNIDTSVETAVTFRAKSFYDEIFEELGAGGDIVSMKLSNRNVEAASIIAAVSMLHGYVNIDRNNADSYTMRIGFPMPVP